VARSDRARDDRIRESPTSSVANGTASAATWNDVKARPTPAGKRKAAVRRQTEEALAVSNLS